MKVEIDYWLLMALVFLTTFMAGLLVCGAVLVHKYDKKVVAVIEMEQCETSEEPARYPIGEAPTEWGI